MPKVFNTDVALEYEKIMKKAFERTKISVLIMGPNKDKTLPSYLLRKYIADNCTGQRISIFPEWKELVKLYKQSAGKYGHFCDYEMGLAKIAKAIIIIPDSAGSFVELGMLSDKVILHPNTLILFSKSHSPTESSFINLGPRKAYRLHHAQIHNIDYTDKVKAWTIVDDFLEQRKMHVFEENQKDI